MELCGVSRFGFEVLSPAPARCEVDLPCAQESEASVGRQAGQVHATGVQRYLPVAFDPLAHLIDLDGGLQRFDDALKGCDGACGQCWFLGAPLL